MLKLKINVNLPWLLCIVISAAENGEFERFGGFSFDCYYTSLEGDKGGKLVFDRSSVKLIFTQMHCLATSNQCGAKSMTVAPWHTKSRPQMLVTSKAAFLKNYLVVIAWILNGSSIEWHDEKRQPFSLSGVRFERRAILISG